MRNEARNTKGRGKHPRPSTPRRTAPQPPERVHSPLAWRANVVQARRIAYLKWCAEVAEAAFEHHQ